LLQNASSDTLQNSHEEKTVRTTGHGGQKCDNLLIIETQCSGQARFDRFPSRLRQHHHTGHDHQATQQAITHRLGTSFAAHCGSRSSKAHISAARSASDKARALANGDDGDASLSAAAGSHALRNVDGVCAHGGER
jgi:hypothetical protein